MLVGRGWGLATGSKVPVDGLALQQRQKRVKVFWSRMSKERGEALGLWVAKMEKLKKKIKLKGGSNLQFTCNYLSYFLFIINIFFFLPHIKLFWGGGAGWPHCNHAGSATECSCNTDLPPKKSITSMIFWNGHISTGIRLPNVHAVGGSW